MSIADELQKLADLKDRGALTESEFEDQKAKLLSRTDEKRPGPTPKPESEPSVPSRKGMSLGTQVSLTIVGLIVLLIGYGATVGGSPESKAKAKDRDAIELCWKDQEKKSNSPGTARMIAEVCEGLENTFRQKYRVNP